MYFKRKNKTKIFDDVYIKDGRVQVQSIKYAGDEYLRVDHLIQWLKINQKADNESVEPNDVYHFIIKSVIKMKNQ